MLRRLSVRIALIITICGPLVFVLFTNLQYIAVLLLGDSVWQNWVWIPLAIVSAPLLMGLLSARYVTRPLRAFVAAIESLRQNNYRTQLRPVGIREFDQVAAKFNALTQRLADEEELRKNLISDTSHELNTPLAAMLGQLTAMEDGVLPITPERVAILKQQTERLIALVAGLDDYTQARLPSAFEEQTPLLLFPICAQLERQLAPSLARHGMSLLVDVPQSYRVQANRAALERMLTNLIHNALRYSHGTVITVSAGETQLAVRDDGQGVPTEQLPHLFERFYRVDASRSRDTGGLGLGLAIVRELAERQGWQVHAEDAGPGLRVVFTLPA